MAADLHPTTTRSDTDVEHALEIMRNANIRRLPVISDDFRPIGMLSLDHLAENVRRLVDAFSEVVGAYRRD